MLSPLSLRDRPRRFRVAAAVAALAAAGGAAVAGLVLFTDDSRPQQVVADNISRNFRACLVTDDPAQPAAQASWAGLQDAARTSHVNAQRIVTPRTATTTRTLLPYVESLVQRRCGLIVSAGPRLDSAVTDAARTHPRQRFVVTSGKPVALPNATVLPAPAAGAVAAAVHAAAGRGPSPAGS